MERSDINAFFLPPEGIPERGGGRLYAAIEIPAPGDAQAEDETGEQEEPPLFECIDAAWCEQVRSGTRQWIELFAQAPLAVLELTTYQMPAFPDGAEPGDIVWFQFGYESCADQEATGRVYRNLFADGAPVRITFHESMGANWAGSGPLGATGWIASSIPTHSVVEKENEINWLRDFLSRITEESAGVAIYDVGQGNCQALVCKPHHTPLIYVDFGGGVLGNHKTFPKDLEGFCFSNYPPIILSHWDWDHWSSAYRFPRALDSYWITPEVPEKPIQQAFAGTLVLRNKLHIFKLRGKASLRCGGIRIEPCTGKTVNDSGLAVTLFSGKFRKRSCLLPGDADYRHIPSVVAGEAFNTICMTHHGGRLHSKTYPVPKRTATAVISSGAHNSYKHPLFDTLAAHFKHGWPVPAQTGFSGQRPCHVLLPWGKPAYLFRGGCHGSGAGCAVAPAALAPAYTGLASLAVSMTKSKAKAKVKAVV